ncbi:MAG: aminopeptidase N C-terminal domain-containing protein, partial [Roseovarius sp.]|nr:aminopeptidase N C-terminal domain-containing protein [Roseovarius sp.]
GDTPDPQAIWQALERLRNTRAKHIEEVARDLYKAHQVTAPYRPDADQAGARALANAALAMISRIDGGALAARQFESADNMTQQLAAWSCLLQAGVGDKATKAFYEQWQKDRLVIDKWFSLQIVHASPDHTAEAASRLANHADFNIRNPNRFRATFGAMVMSPAGFHHASGKGYRVLADWLIRLDPLNPQTTARMCSAFETWRRYDDARQALIKAELERILATPGLSRDTTEMVTRIRGV